MTKKYVQNDPKWKTLAKRWDDLKYVLLTYGRQFSPEVLRAIQKDFKKADTVFNRYEKTLFKKGYWTLA